MNPKKLVKESKFDIDLDYEQSGKEICKTFLKEYNKKNKEDFRFVRSGDPNINEPACICTDNLNIEIAPVYYNQEEAKATWGLVKLMKKREKEGNGNRKNKDIKDYLANANLLFCDSLNERINSKNNKQYNYTGKLFLVIEESMGLTEKESVEYFIKQGKKFSKNIFKEIWLMVQSAGHYKIYRLT